MNIFEFMDDNWFLTALLSLPTFILCLAFLHYATGLISNLIFRLPNRVLRCISVSLRGWPPSHCDSDGDLMTEDFVAKVVKKAVREVKKKIDQPDSPASEDKG